MNWNSKEAYPKAYNSLTDEPGANENRAEVFEPALKHYPHAVRLAEPEIEQAAAERWNHARMQVIEYLLDIVHRSEWRENLVLRGSLLLRAWLGAAARNPGDIDWIVTPSSITLEDSFTRNFFDGLIWVASKNPHLDDAITLADKITVDDIWTYERAPGRRIVFPWQAAGLPIGAVQMDFVFGENLFSEPELIEIPTNNENSILALGASREISLAWKLLWLATDDYPQGKDLYDATLLAEQTFLPASLLKQVFEDNDLASKIDFTPDLPMKWEIDWSNFQAEYPWIEGKSKDWQMRLTAALKPTFTNER